MGRQRHEAAAAHYRTAADYYKRALVIARAVNDRRAEGNRLANLGNTYSALAHVQRDGSEVTPVTDDQEDNIAPSLRYSD